MYEGTHIEWSLEAQLARSEAAQPSNTGVTLILYFDVTLTTLLAIKYCEVTLNYFIRNSYYFVPHGINVSPKRSNDEIKDWIALAVAISKYAIVLNRISVCVCLV